MNRKTRQLFTLLGLLLAMPALAQVSEDGELDEDNGTIYEKAARLIGSFQSLGNWDEHYGYMVNSLDSVFDRQGWDSESDMFALDLVKTVESVPPWAVQERFDTMTMVLSDRYLLDEDQERSMRGMMIRTSNEMFQRHSNRIMKYAVEAIQTRAMGEPFTADQVQRWVKLAEPVFLDSRQRLETVSKEFMQQLDPEQQELLQRDIDAANKRMDRMLELSQSWKQGKWKAEDWGMENDPIQLSGELRQAEEAADAQAEKEALAREKKDREQEAEDVRIAGQRPNRNEARSKNSRSTTNPQQDPWLQYAEAFIEKYQLRNDQSQRARQIATDVVNRRDELTKRYDTKIAAAAGSNGAATLQAKKDSLIKRVFGQMERRLDRLPTRAQRRDAPDVALPNPLQPKTPQKPSRK